MPCARRSRYNSLRCANSFYPVGTDVSLVTHKLIAYQVALLCLRFAASRHQLTFTRLYNVAFLDVRMAPCCFMAQRKCLCKIYPDHLRAYRRPNMILSPN